MPAGRLTGWHEWAQKTVSDIDSYRFSGAAYDAAFAGISATALNRATVAGMKRRAVENRAPRVIGSGS